MTWLRNIGFALAALAAVGSYFALLQIQLTLEEYRPKIARKLSKLTGLPVTLGGMDISLVNGMTIVIFRLEIQGSDATMPPLLQVERVDVSLGLNYWLTGKPEIASLTLQQPQINLVANYQQKLLEQAQTQTQISNRQFSDALGIGLNELVVDQLVIRDGLITVIDWQDPAGHTWIVDQMQAQVYGIAPNSPGSITGSARFQGAPYRAIGQIGPLPGNLDLLDLPILISLEAKTLYTDHLLRQLIPESYTAKASRGYFSATLHGNLRRGLQTSASLELTGLQVSAPVEPSWQPPVMDLTIRQKSTFDYFDNRLRCRIEEGFIADKGSPFLGFKGNWQWAADDRMHLLIQTIRDLPADHLPPLPGHPILAGTWKGNLLVYGNYPEWLQVEGDLDLGQLQITIPQLGMVKKPGIPLSVSGKLQWREALMVLEQVTMTNPTLEGQEIRITGSVQPKLSLHLAGSWDLGRINDYFQAELLNGSKGLAEIDAFWIGGWHTPYVLEGSLHSGTSHWLGLPVDRGEVSFRFQEGGLEVPTILLQQGTGMITGGVSLRTMPRGHLVGWFGLANLSLDSWLEASEVRLSGNVSGQVELLGDLTPTAGVERLTGSAYLQIAPARMEGIDPAGLITPPLAPKLLNTKGKAIHWQEAMADLVWLDQTLRLDNLELVAFQQRWTGSGVLRTDRSELDLVARPEEWIVGPPFPLRLEAIGHLWTSLPSHPEQLP